MTLPHMDAPPIIEAICGVGFRPMALDPMLLGTYWQERKAQFPGRALHPPIADSGVVFFGGQSRVWMITKEDDLVLQFQPDRFYLNWRLRDGDYPRFNDHPELGPAKEKGLLTKALDEYELFEDFCERAVGARPFPVRIEVAKVDLFSEPKHWRGFDDLAEMLPWLKTFAAFRKSEAENVGVQFAEPRVGGTLQVTLTSATEGQPPSKLLKMETRITTGAPLATQEGHTAAKLRPLFMMANAEINGVFESLVPREQYWRFSNRGAK